MIGLMEKSLKDLLKKKNEEYKDLMLYTQRPEGLYWEIYHYVGKERLILKYDKNEYFDRLMGEWNIIAKDIIVCLEITDKMDNWKEQLESVYQLAEAHVGCQIIIGCPVAYMEKVSKDIPNGMHEYIL